MNNIKKKVFLMMLVFACAISIIIIFVFNFTMNNYIEHGSKKAIQSELEMIERSFDSNGFFIEQFNKSNNGFNVNSIIVDNYMIDNYSEKAAGEYWLSGEDNKVLNFFVKKSYLLKEGEIKKVVINSEKYYIAHKSIVTSVPFYMDYWANSELETSGYSMEYILYVNVSAISEFTKTLNIIFSCILVAFLVLAIVVGIKAGSMIENSERKLKTFFENSSHELKTPLMSIQGYAEGLQTGIIKDEKSAIQIILEESDKMSALINEILFLSKIDSGQFVFKNENINLKELIYSCVSSMETVAQKKDVIIEIECVDNNVNILGDEQQLAKAILNLLSNAVRYAKSKIDIVCRYNKKNIEIVISDDGVGISGEDLPHIFERFYSGANGNTGIGLSLAKEIIEKHNGKIFFENSNQVTSFIIKLNSQD